VLGGFAIAVGLAVAVLGVFGHAAGYDFIELDDHGYVVDNAMVKRGLSGESIAWAFTSFHQPYWHPLTWISLMVDASIGGEGPRAFHVGNIAYHAAATILLFLLLERLTGRWGRSAAAALLFAIHPLRVRVGGLDHRTKGRLVASPGIRRAVRVGPLGRKPTKIRYATALGLFAAGLLAKPMLVTLPVLMLLLDRWPLDRFDLARGVREKLPFFGLAAASAVLTSPHKHTAESSAAWRPFRCRRGWPTRAPRRSTTSS
jgi:hypothetical protein